jgi:alcohol dehydrogenase
VNLDSNTRFDFVPRTKIVFGPGALERLPELVRDCGGKRILLVTDPGVVQAGHAARAQALLNAAGLRVAVFDRVVENPTVRVVEDCAAYARQEKPDFLVGLGGGSSLDAAKGCNFLLTNGGRMEDYWGVGKARSAMLPLIAVPTTAGTGSECQSFALISQDDSHVKMACGDPKAAPKAAILDPVLTLTQPRQVAMATAMDAICHAVESAVTRNRNPLSQMFSREAFRLCSRGLHGVLDDPTDLEARGQLLLGAALAGMAIENSMLGAAHAAANPLTAHFGAVHGEAVGILTPAVVRYNAKEDESRRAYQDLVSAAGLANGVRGPGQAAATLADYLEECLRLAELPRSLAHWGVRERDLETLSNEAARQWTARFNPRPVEKSDFLRLYRSVLQNGEFAGWVSDSSSQRLPKSRRLRKSASQDGSETHPT